MTKYQNKYRIESNRAYWWNYGWNGAYFITICTQNREHFFGEIIDNEMHLSPLGAIVDVLWHEIPNRNKNIELGDYIVMPNHIHGILILDKPDFNQQNYSLNTTGANDKTKQDLQVKDVACNDSTNDENSNFYSSISPKSNTISTIIRSFKSAVTKHANRMNLENGWQTNFHDQLIRNNKDYQKISDYIVQNPKNWKMDTFYSN
jgi:REP element-mobilizing transposase RayT